ncbi:MAG: hypothetical protein NUV48_06215, partial [Peptococcaceae bacterium]|nr:hypothetical protein [Peptococcaceae bacterium]
MAKKTKRISASDLLFLILMMAWLYELDLTRLTPARYAGLAAAVIWFVLFFELIAMFRGPNSTSVERN